MADILPLEKEDIRQAIKRIKENPSLKDGRESSTYDLVHNGNTYPPILVLSEANKIRGGEKLTLSDFGNNTEKAFKILKDYGFRVMSKNNSENNQKSIIPTLSRFIQQAKTGNQKKAHFRDTYKGLRVDIGFGIGRVAHVPWMSFLGKGQKTSQGIYPVYLYYKEKVHDKFNRDKLILAYGVSSNNKPSIQWDVNAPTVKEYFLQKDWGEPYKYGESYVFQYYDLQKDLESYSIDEDLNTIIREYKSTLNNKNESNKRERTKYPLSIKSFTKDAREASFILDDELAYRFVSSLCTKPFLILTGLSGSGKTKLAQVFTEWICEDESQVNLVPVGADWTNREPLLGYPNALKEKDYVWPESEVLQLLLDAINNPSLPYFLILDEMNLSHVERYFADFLSAMESEKEIQLHPGEGEWNGVPDSISIPKNLFVIGTVNIDETTYMFSPKVLDRANVIEFRVTHSQIDRFLENPSDVSISDLRSNGAHMARAFVDLATSTVDNATYKDQLKDELVLFFNELSKVGAEFGYRSAFEIQRFISLEEQLTEDWNFHQHMDAAIVQKLLPKLHGSRRKLEPVLKKLVEICVTDEEFKDEVFNNPDNRDYWDNDKVKYPISLEKIKRMQKNLLDNGFTSFAEA